MERLLMSPCSEFTTWGSHRLPPVAICVVSLLMVCGCGGGDRPDTIATSGIVTYQGKPVEGAQVMFTSEVARPASATTDGAGRFELTTFRSGDGAVASEYCITITKSEILPTEDTNNPYAQTRNALPGKYANPQTTPLTAKIVGGSPTELSFALED